MAIRLADTARPNNYVDDEHLGTYPVAYAEDVWFEDGTRLSEKTFDGQSIQVDELPLASADELGNIYQYVGETGTYTKGYFYECVSDGETPPTFSWKEAVGGSGYHFSEDFVEEEGNVSLVASQRIFTGTQAEWDALSLSDKKMYGQVNITDDESGANLDYYSTSETKTNKVWIDGNPIYRKVLVVNQTISSDTTMPSTIPNDASDYWINYGESYFVAPDASSHLPLTYPHPVGLQYQITTWLGGKDTIALRLGSAQSISKMVVVLEYTKEG